MKFEKYIFGTALNGWSIAKYTDGECVRIVAEHSDFEDAGERTFESVDAYEAWIDEIVDDETANYNKAQAVNLVLKALRDE
jgi:hypothetical protein